MPVNLANLLTARTVESTSRYIRELTNDANEIDYQTQCLRKPRGIKVAFIPIFGDGHWSLLVYRVKTRSRLPEFLHFNSYLNSTRANHTQCARQALINLLYVFRANDPAMVISHDTYKLVIKNCPQQSNGNDCGVYVCMYAYILSARLARENEGRRNAFQNIFHRLTSSTTAQAAADREGPDRLLYSTKNARKDAPVDPEDQLWRIKEVAQADEMRGYIVKVINRATVSSRRSRSANL
ncbi:hypothetical protein EV175_003792 [Coemansia sp. RSA 1933]|nr:hypothetical protein EV175_003792 [Coemansia sp. RSA 1933]